MQLQVGKSAEDAIRLLEKLEAEGLNNLRNTVPRPGSDGYHQMPAFLNKYREWIREATRLLREIFASDEIVSRLRGETYWILMDSNPHEGRTSTVIHAEVEDLSTFMRECANELRVTSVEFARYLGAVLVLDTNDMLHYQRFDRIPWVNIYGKDVTVVIPHVVVDEIDAKSYNQAVGPSSKARGAYRLLDVHGEELLDEGFVGLQDGTRVEILKDPPRHVRLPNNDNEIVARAAYLQQFLSSGTVKLVSRDIGTRARAKAYGLISDKLPDRFLLTTMLAEKELNQALRLLDVEGANPENESVA